MTTSRPSVYFPPFATRPDPGALLFPSRGLFFPFSSCVGRFVFRSFQLPSLRLDEPAQALSLSLSLSLLLLRRLPFSSSSRHNRSEERVALTRRRDFHTAARGHRRERAFSPPAAFRGLPIYASYVGAHRVIVNFRAVSMRDIISRCNPATHNERYCCQWPKKRQRCFDFDLDSKLKLKSAIGKPRKLPS